VTIGLEIVFLVTADVETEHFAVGGAIIAALVGFIIPFVYTRRNTSLWGYIELARLFDGPKFSGGSKKLRSKYEEGQEISEDDLRIAAEQVRSELNVVMGMIGTENILQNLNQNYIVGKTNLYFQNLKLLLKNATILLNSG